MTAVRLERRSCAAAGPHRTGDGEWRYALQPGLELIAKASGGALLFARRPLMALRLNARASALLSALGPQGTTADAAARSAGVSPAEAAPFFDRLLQRRLLTREPPPPSRWPEVSIIVAARNRPAATRACVQSLLALDYPADRREIIVVDDASDPPLAAALGGLPIRLLRLERNVGQSAARNLAAAEAAGEVLAFTDNDCVADPGWLRALIPHFRDPEVAIVGGRVIAAKAPGVVAAYEAVRSPLDMGAAPAPVAPDQSVAYLPTCNLLVRRDALLAQAGFAGGMRVGEDVDFCWRTLRGGARAVYVPGGRITHDHRVRLGALLRRRADYGASEADLQRRHPTHRRVMPVPRLSLLALGALTAFGVSWAAGTALGALVLGLLAAETAGKHRRLGRLGLALPRARVTAAVLREHLASLHGLSANALRYYGVPLAAAGALWWPLLPATLVLLLLAPVLDHRRLQPAVRLPAFVGLSALEMAAYQYGVWHGCLDRRTLRPLLPTLAWRR